MWTSFQADIKFQHTAARRRLVFPKIRQRRIDWFQHTAARRRLVFLGFSTVIVYRVSTHSRPKAAGTASTLALVGLAFQHTAARRRLGVYIAGFGLTDKFQHTAARRRLVYVHSRRSRGRYVSTHSRPKAAGQSQCSCYYLDKVSTHSRPKAAGTSRNVKLFDCATFQHTAARRRLVMLSINDHPDIRVSTHSRPKAAGWQSGRCASCCGRFNTQPPEGGWICLSLWNG